MPMTVFFLISLITVNRFSLTVIMIIIQLFQGGALFCLREIKCEGIGFDLVTAFLPIVTPSLLSTSSSPKTREYRNYSSTFGARHSSKELKWIKSPPKKTKTKLRKDEYRNLVWIFECLSPWRCVGSSLPEIYHSSPVVYPSPPCQLWYCRASPHSSPSALIGEVWNYKNLRVN